MLQLRGNHFLQFVVSVFVAYILHSKKVDPFVFQRGSGETTERSVSFFLHLVVGVDVFAKVFSVKSLLLVQSLSLLR